MAPMQEETCNQEEETGNRKKQKIKLYNIQWLVPSNSPKPFEVDQMPFLYV